MHKMIPVNNGDLLPIEININILFLDSEDQLTVCCPATQQCITLSLDIIFVSKSHHWLRVYRLNRPANDPVKTFLLRFEIYFERHDFKFTFFVKRNQLFFERPDDLPHSCKILVDLPDTRRHPQNLPDYILYHISSGKVTKISPLGEMNAKHSLGHYWGIQWG